MVNLPFCSFDVQSTTTLDKLKRIIYFPLFSVNVEEALISISGHSRPLYPYVCVVLTSNDSLDVNIGK